MKIRPIFNSCTFCHLISHLVSKNCIFFKQRWVTLHILVWSNFLHLKCKNIGFFMKAITQHEDKIEIIVTMVVYGIMIHLNLVEYTYGIRTVCDDHCRICWTNNLYDCREFSSVDCLLAKLQTCTKWSQRGRKNIYPVAFFGFSAPNLIVLCNINYNCKSSKPTKRNVGKGTRSISIEDPVIHNRNTVNIKRENLR